MGPGGTTAQFLTGNDGIPVPSDSGFNINVIGDNSTGINDTGNVGTNTLTIHGLASSTTQVGTTRYATNAEAAAQTIGTAALTPANITSLFSTNPVPSSQGGTGLSSPAAHQLIVTEGSSAYTALGVATNGQIPIGSTASDPVLATITAGTGVTITNGPGTITISASGSVVMETLTGNTGGAISPVAGNINTLGTGSITIAGSGNTLTTQLTGLTNHSVQVGAGSATLTQLTVGTNGQVLIGATTADPAFATLTSSDSSITFTTGANTLSLQVAGGSTVGKTITGNSGGALSPTSGNWNILGTGSITTVGSGSTLTTQLTGLTNHNVLLGAGTATITNVAPSATSGVPLISQGVSADPLFGTAVVAGGGTGQTSLTNHGVLVGAGTSAITQLAAGSAGQALLSGGASANPAYSTPTYPSASGTTGTILRSDGTNNVYTTATYPATTTINQVLYSSAANTIAGITTANNGTFITGTTGVPSVLANGTTGQVLTATTGSPPSWGTAGGGVTNVTGQIFTASGAFTYTPTSGTKWAIVELVGGGGGSGGTVLGNTGQGLSGAGGGGAYARFILTSAQIGASLTGSVGVGGAAGASGNNNGVAGGNTTLATTAAWTVGGGGLGVGGAGNQAAGNVAGGAGGTNTTGTGTILANVAGTAGQAGLNNTVVVMAGAGGSSFYGKGAPTQFLAASTTAQFAGAAGVGYGAGASAACSFTGGAVNEAGAAGITGVAIFTEFQ
jgi:hypothetical protein